MISYIALVAQIYVLFRFNDLLQSLGHPKLSLIKIQWSLMISYKASVAQIAMCLF